MAQARGVFERFVQTIPKITTWLKFAKFEIKNGTPLRAREVINLRGDQL